jgi:hypothetical protein
MKETAANTAPLEKKRYVFDSTRDDDDTDAKDDLIDAINKDWCMVRIGKKLEYMNRDGRGAMQFLTEYAAKTELAPFKFIYLDTSLKTPKNKSVPGFKIWSESPQRKHYKKLVFNPDKTAVLPSELNVFEGWGVTPRKGDWSLMQKHMLDNICDGNQEHYDYLLKVLSQMVYEPQRKGGICIALLGDEGVGKNTFTDAVKTIIGPKYSCSTSNPDHALGQFNAFIRYKVLCVLAESPVTGDRRNTFAALITDHDMASVSKGVDPEEVLNYTRFIILVNGDRAVPALAGDRRFFVLRVGAAQKENKTYFGAVLEQMAKGGHAAMLHDLLEMKVTMRDLPKPPMTQIKAEQIRFGMKAEMEWLESVVCDGQLPFMRGRPTMDEVDFQGKVSRSIPDTPIAWPENGAVRMLGSDVVASFNEYCQASKKPATARKVSEFLRRQGIAFESKQDRDGNARPYYWTLPPLKDMQAAWLKLYPHYVFEKPEAAVDQQPEAAVDQQPEATVDQQPEATVIQMDAAKKARRSRFTS